MSRSKLAAAAAIALCLTPDVPAGPPQSDFDRSFSETVRPFLDQYCVACHGGTQAAAQFDLRRYKDVSSVVADLDHWSTVLTRVSTGTMPPQGARQPEKATRDAVVAWIAALRKEEARRNAGDPGIVLARRLSNTEYDYTIRDLTGVDIRPAREFPVDPANQAGFDNSGESLSMSPSLLNKHLQAAREVASHLVLRPTGISFAPHPALAETDRDKYCVTRIIDFYHRQNTDYADYFLTAWRYKRRAAAGKPRATLAEFAAEGRVSPKYLATVWRALEESKEEVGPLAKLQAMWRALPENPVAARAGCEGMRDWVAGLRAKVEMRFPDLSVAGIARTAQPFLMWRNRQYATHRLDYDRGALQVDGEARAVPTPGAAPPREGIDDGSIPAAPPPRRHSPTPDLHVPAGQRPAYEAAFARFAAIFPDAFYIQERGRYFPDPTRDKGRYLSAGFHNLMGYFRDDAPLYQLVLDANQQQELDALWKELDFVAAANIRTYMQFYLFETKEAAKGAEGAPIPDKEITSEERIGAVAESYLARARAAKNETAVRAIEEHFRWVNEGIRQVESARVEAEPVHLEAIQEFAARAWRRPLTAAERDDLPKYYREIRAKDALSHEDAMRDLVVNILVSPDFSYRINSLAAAVKPERAGVAPLSDYSLASRLSYFLWSSMPDRALLDRAAAGQLRDPEVLSAEARRMLKDPRARGLAVEFGTNWLDVRRFEEHNAVDRERFPVFTGELRKAMFEEPVRFFLDVVGKNRSVLDFLYARDTFVNAPLAAHYGMTGVRLGVDEWARVENAADYGRGGLLPMAVFLTKNAPGLRTSPVKRGYWVARRVLGDEIPPPPAVVPELPRDEAKMDLPLRDMLARHRQDASCASCHTRFDGFGLVFERYGPVGERRSSDLAGRAVDTKADLPGGGFADGLDGLRAFIRERRQNDFVDNLCRKLFAYALGRGLILADDPTIEQMRTGLAAREYRFEALIDAIVRSPQFRTGRMPLNSPKGE